MVYNEISPLVSQVMPSQSAKSRDYFYAPGGIDSQNAFPSPIIHSNQFPYKSKNTLSERENLLAN